MQHAQRQREAVADAPAPRLFTERQRQFYQQLLGHNLPSFFRELFSDLYRALDWLQALTRYSFEKPGRAEWVAPKVWKQAVELPHQKLVEFIKLGWDRVDFSGTGKQTIDPDALVSPFHCEEGKVNHAARIINRLIDALFCPDMLMDQGIVREIPLRYLILTALKSGTWIMFCQAVHQGDGVAVEALQKLVSYMACRRYRPHFVALSSFDFDAVFYGPEGFAGALTKLFCQGERMSIIPVPDPFVGSFRGYCEETQLRLSRRRAEVGKVVENFVEHRAFFVEQYERMWSDIRSPRKGIPPDGLAVVKVQANTLTSIGYRHMQLFTHDDAFAHVNFRLFVELVLPKTEVYIEREVVPNSPLAPFTNEPDPLLAAAQEIQKFVVVKAIREICCSPVKHCSGSGQNSGGGRPLRRPPSAHYMKLAGRCRKVSSRAVARAEQAHWQPPPQGYTFYLSELTAPVGYDPWRHPVLVLTDRDLQIQY